MKKAISLILAFVMCLAMTACGGSEEPAVHTCSGEWVVVEEATCQKAGSRQRTCSCGEVTTETIPTLDHTYEDGACTACGLKDPDYVPAYSVGLTFESKGNGTCAVTGMGTCTDKDLVIPDTSDTGEKVTEIKYWAFIKADITSVVIPEGVTHIGPEAFKKCENLQSITIPSSVTYIGGGAFLWCDNVSKVYISDLEAWCKIKFPNGDSGVGQPLMYGDNADLYLNGQKITDLVIPEGITTLQNCVFYGCSSLESVTIPESVTSISTGAFCECDSLVSITIPKSVTSFGGSVFSNCDKLATVTLCSETMPVIESFLFWECPALQAVVVPDDLAGQYAQLLDWDQIADKIMLESNGGSAGPSDFSVGLEFTSYGNGTCYVSGIGTCTDTEIKIPESSPAGDVVVEIGDMAFYRAFQSHTQITAVVIPDTVTRIGSNAFRDCNNMTEVTVGTKVTYLGDHVFEGCSSLKTLDLPASLTSADADMLYDCDGLTTLTLRCANRVSWPLDEILRQDDPLFSRITAVYVPAELVAEYQAATGWSLFGDKIQAITEDTDK